MVYVLNASSIHLLVCDSASHKVDWDVGKLALLLCDMNFVIVAKIVVN